MASVNAQNAAKEVIKRMDKGEKVVMGEILENIGYAKNTADNPVLVTETDSYKEVMEPFAKRLEKELSRVQTAMEGKDLDKEQYRVLADALDKLNKNHQLVTGGATENQVINIQLDNSLASKYATNPISTTDSE